MKMPNIFVDTIPNTYTGSLVLCICLLITYNIIFAVYNLYFHPLAKFPSSKISSISRVPLIFAHIKGKQHEYICNLHAKYGPITRTAPDELSTTTPGVWRDVYQKRPGLIKDPFTRTPPPNGSETLFTAEGETHQRLRRMFVAVFSDKALREMASVMDFHASRLNFKLANDCFKDGRGRLDMTKYYGYVTLDIMGELAFGGTFHSLDPDSEHGWLLGFFLGAKFGSVRTSLSRYYPFDYIVGWTFLRLTSRIRQRNIKIAQDMITRRLDLGKLGPGKCDLVDPLIGKVNDDPKNGVTRDELDINVGSLLLAGSPLSTLVITAATYFLLRYPDTLFKLTQEIRTKFDSEQSIVVDSVNDMPYLEAVIMETLRIHHPTPSDPKPRVIGPEGQMIDGYWIPEGTVIGAPMQAMYHSAANFSHPLEFHPERWLPETDARYDSRFLKDDKAAFQPFSTGSRSCMGRKLFLAEGRLILCKVFWKFDMQLEDQGDWTWPDQRAWLAYEPKPLMVKLSDRFS